MTRRAIFACCLAATLAAATACYESGRFTLHPAKSNGGLFGNDSEAWTIECAVLQGRDHARDADELAQALRNVRELKSSNVTVVHDPHQSTIYYGDYSVDYNRNTDSVVLPSTLQADTRFIRSLALGGRQPPFFSAHAVPKSTPDNGPPEWNLANAKGEYTLQVGYTQNTATFHQRKQAAIEWVRDLRGRGHEAYYYHSPNKPISLITVGSFDDSAVKTSSPGRHYYSDAVRAIQAREEFAFNLVNGAKEMRVAEDGKRIPEPSFLVRIPHPAQSAQSSP